MTTNHTTDGLAEKLRGLSVLCTPGCNGRCIECPQDVAQKAADELTRLRARVAQLEAEREAMAKQEPVAYWNKGTSIIPAVDVSYLPNWSDYYPYPLFASPKP